MAPSCRLQERRHTGARETSRRGFHVDGLRGKTQTKAGVLRELPKRAIADERDAAVRQYTYGDMGDVEVDSSRDHVLRVWVKRAGGWKAMVYQEVRYGFDAPPSFAPGAGKDSREPVPEGRVLRENPIEREVIAAYSKLETAAMGHNSAQFATLVADEFVAASSNSNKLSDKRSRMEDRSREECRGSADAAHQRADVRLQRRGSDAIGAHSGPGKTAARDAGLG